MFASFLSSLFFQKWLSVYRWGLPLLVLSWCMQEFLLEANDDNALFSLFLLLDLSVTCVRRIDGDERQVP